MRKWLTLLALFIALLVPFINVKAQNPISFDSLNISVWPEYDTPTVLVINRITLAPETTLPAKVTFRMPSQVGKVHVVAVGKTADTISDSGVESTFTPGGDYSQVVVNATGRFLQIEYYDPSLTKTGNQRLYTFSWLGDNNVANFRFEFRQPLQSSNVSIDPPLKNPTVDSDGFQLSELIQTGVKAGQKLTFNIKYQRDTDAPSTSFLKVQSTAPLDQTLPGQFNWTTWLPWGLGGLGLVLLLIVGWVYWSSSKNNRTSVRVRKRHIGARTEEEGDDQNQAHCTQCGKRLQPGDRFCRVCGARVRRSTD